MFNAAADEMMVATDLAAKWGMEDAAGGTPRAIPLRSPEALASYREAFLEECGRLARQPRHGKEIAGYTIFDRIEPAASRCDFNPCG